MPNLQARCAIPRITILMSMCGAKSGSGADLILLRNSANMRYPSDRYLQSIVKTGALSSKAKAIELIDIFKHHLRKRDVVDFLGYDEIIAFDSIIPNIISFVAMMQFSGKKEAIAPIFNLAADSEFTEAVIQSILDQKLMPRLVCDKVADKILEKCGRKPSIVTLSDADGEYELPDIEHGRLDVISIIANQVGKPRIIARSVRKTNTKSESAAVI